MAEQDLINITVLIAGRPYPLKVKPDDESTVRMVVKEINDKINRFQITYAQKDKQDCLAMTLLTYAVELQKSISTQPDDEFVDKVNHIDALLNTALSHF